MRLLGFLLFPAVFATCSELTIDDYLIKIENNTLTSIRSMGESSTRLNLSSLDIQLIDRDAFKNLSDLAILDLANNSLFSLPNSVFSGLTNLKRLSLAGNKIGRTDNAFVGLGNLEALDMSNNELQFIPPAGFYGLSSSVEITTLGNRLEKISPRLFQEKRAPVRERRQAIRNKRTPSTSDSKAKDITILCIDDGKLRWATNSWTDEFDHRNCDVRNGENYDEYLLTDTAGIKSFGQNWYNMKSQSIREMWLFWNDIEEVTSEMLNNLPRNIVDVNLSHNNIVRVNRGVIENYHLRTINMDDNNIEIIENGAFERTHLEVLRLTDNRLKDIGFAGTLPSSLLVLDLGNNRLTDIPDDTFSSLDLLESLDLYHNRITNIGKNSFRGLSNLNFLGLSGNRISVIEPGTFKDTISLEKIELRDNLIGKLEIGTFAGPRSFSWLDLTGNKFTNVAEQIRDALPVSLLELILDFNKIESLQYNDFANVPVLELTLRNINISRIEKGSFNLPDLRRLNLGVNSLSRIDGQLFENCSSLRGLSLDENAITRIEKGFAKHLNYLTHLDISRNPIKRLERGAFYGIPTNDYRNYILTAETPIELIQGGLFEDL